MQLSMVNRERKKLYLLQFTLKTHVWDKILFKMYNSCLLNFWETLTNVIVDMNILWFFYHKTYCYHAKAGQWTMLERTVNFIQVIYYSCPVYATETVTRKIVCCGSASMLQGQKRFNVSLKPCLNFCSHTTIFIIFWGFLMFYQIFLSPQVRS